MYFEACLIGTTVLACSTIIIANGRQREHKAKVAMAKTISDAFPVFDDKGLDEVEHHCEWHILQERKRLQRLLMSYIKGDDDGD